MNKCSIIKDQKSRRVLRNKHFGMRNIYARKFFWNYRQQKLFTDSFRFLKKSFKQKLSVFYEKHNVFVKLSTYDKTVEIFVKK